VNSQKLAQRPVTLVIDTVRAARASFLTWLYLDKVFPQGHGMPLQKVVVARTSDESTLDDIERILI
jgi:hypothetical protein